jgi:hypothetical protein
MLERASTNWVQLEHNLACTLFAHRLLILIHIYSVFQRSTKMDIELVIIITVGTVLYDS